MTVLLLAGTTEGRHIATAMADERIDGHASIAGVTEDPAPLDLPMRVGGFGGSDGFEAFLDDRKIRAVVDATHPFAARITSRTAAICTARGMPYLHVLRPPWIEEEGDDWVHAASIDDAIEAVPLGACVFLATGRQTLGEFAGLEGRRVICRVIDPPREPFPFEGGEFVIGRPSVHVEDEIGLFEELGVDVIVTKNSGGPGRGKLDAARALGIDVVMIARPPMPKAERVATVEEALHWIRRL